MTFSYPEMLMKQPASQPLGRPRCGLPGSDDLMSRIFAAEAEAEAGQRTAGDVWGCKQWTWDVNHVRNKMNVKWFMKSNKMSQKIPEILELFDHIYSISDLSDIFGLLLWVAMGEWSGIPPCLGAGGPAWIPRESQRFVPKISPNQKSIVLDTSLNTHLIDV